MGKDGVTRFGEGVDVGDRWFDGNAIQPLFPFGYRLSYTQLTYQDVKVAKAADGGMDFSFSVHNTGRCDSDEVPQVYLAAPQTSRAQAAFAVHALAGFTRLHIAAGATDSVSVHVSPRSLQYWSVVSKGWETAHGQRELLVGGSSRDLPLHAIIEAP